MPARFVEVANPLEVARKSGSLTYVTSHFSWRPFNLSNFTYPQTNVTNFTLGRVVTVAQHFRAPVGVAKYCLVIGGVLYVAQAILLHIIAKKKVAAYGHAHCD